MRRNNTRRNKIRSAAAIAAAGITAAGVLSPAAAQAAAPQKQSTPYSLSAVFEPLPTKPSTVLTLEGGIIGLQTLLHFTPLQLRGDLCKSPNTCKPANYFAMPLGPWFNELGAKKLATVVAAQPVDENIILFGHSQGGEVIYTTLRYWKNNPEVAPDPSRVTWVSIGNPQNRYGGGGRLNPSMPYVNIETLPPDSPYKGIEVIRQYDGWADYPSDTSNLLAVINASIGQGGAHTDYWKVDLNDPNNVVYTPDNPDGTPGNVTYVYVPTKTLPLISGMGIFAPMLDKLLRPIVEKAYNRPVQLPDPHAPELIPASAAVRASATVPAVDKAAPLAVQAPEEPRTTPRADTVDDPTQKAPAAVNAAAPVDKTPRPTLPTIDLGALTQKPVSSRAAAETRRSPGSSSRQSPVGTGSAASAEAGPRPAAAASAGRR